MITGIKLTDSRIDRVFRNAIIGATAVSLIWTGVVAAQTSAAHALLSSKKAILDSKKTELQTQDIAFRTRRRASKQIGAVPAAVPFQGTSAFAYSVDTIARAAGASLLNIRFGDTSINNAKSPTFECEVGGRFPSLLRVVDGVSSGGFGAVIASTTITREKVDPQSGATLAKLRIQGTIGK